MGHYLPSTEQERAEMLKAVGLSSVRDLYRDVPGSVYREKPLDLPEGKSEMEVSQYLRQLGDSNKSYRLILRGAGAYDHYIPSIVKYIPAKEEFLTAYTPYQAEISQGILQSIFEYQTMICELTGMEVSNASVYDGATAAAEGCTMCRSRKRSVTLVSAAAHPDVIATIRTYCYGVGAEMKLVPEKDGVTDVAALKELLTPDVASVYFAQPNFSGLFENAEAIIAAAHEAGAMVVMGCNPIALALMKTPGELGADVAVGEGQPLGMPLSYGGPYLGFMAATKKNMRSLPGRIVGETKDAQGRRAFVLSLQAREQHIRREKATSNICSNESLMALWVTVYLSLMGPQGMKQVNVQSSAGAHYLYDKLLRTGQFEPVFEAPFLKEFVLKPLVNVEELQQRLYDAGFFAALQTEEGYVSFCVTEKHTQAEIDALVAAIEEERV